MSSPKYVKRKSQKTDSHAWIETNIITIWNFPDNPNQSDHGRGKFSPRVVPAMEDRGTVRERFRLRKKEEELKCKTGGFPSTKVLVIKCRQSAVSIDG